MIARADRLPDRAGRHLPLLLVGINPGLRSAAVGHHFAGRGNRFWDLLYESGLTPRRFTPEEDALLPGLGVGITNLAPRPTRGVSDLDRADYARGRRALTGKLARLRPKTVAFVGVTAYREFRRRTGPVTCGLQAERIARAAVFVLPNPSGRNAHFTYREMLRHYRALADFVRRLRPSGR